MRQSKCGCWQRTEPRRAPWFYRPQWYFHRWSPVWLGGDEWCRRTLVIGWSVTGQMIIPLRECRGCEDCGPHVINGVWCREEAHDAETAEAWSRWNRDPRRYNLDAVELELGGDASTNV